MHSTQLRVRLEETDAMGIVWHGNYLRYFEIGRVEWARALFSDDAMKVVISSLAAKTLHIEYHQPAKLDDLLTIKTRIKTKKKFMLLLGQDVYRSDTLIVSGEIVGVFIDPQGKIQLLPPFMREKNIKM